VNTKLFARRVFDALLRQLDAAAEIRGVAQPLQHQVNVVWHHTVREICEVFFGACLLNLRDCCAGDCGRLEYASAREGREA
jgi:hypothetical protein